MCGFVDILNTSSYAKSTPEFILPRDAQSNRMSGSGVINQVGTEWLCSYRNKICPNKRAMKKNGELHRLCEEHRLRATQTQKRMMERRARGEQDEASTYEPSDEPMALTAEDLEALRLLSDSECACCNTQPPH